MDVVCGRCRAEYEFDDALISERGTTVRCTNCGLQFKVFPPVGLRAPEVWQVMDPKDRRVEPVQYESLRELQKAIARGDVRAEHLLSRGEERPRPLSEIVELQPLLQQPRSEPPPPSGSAREAQVPAASPVGMGSPRGSSTVMGIQTRPDPGSLPDAPAPPAVAADDDDDDPVIVPSSPPEPIDAPSPHEGTESRPRIRSALSMSPAGNSPSGSAAAAASSAAPTASSAAPTASGSIAPPRQSLRSTLSGSFPPPAQVGAASLDREADEAAARQAEAKQEQAKQEQAKQEQAQQEQAQQRAEEERAHQEQRGAPPPVEPAPQREVARPAVTAPIEPQITDSGEYPGQLTPTPSGMRAYRSPDAQPVSSVAGVPVKRGARSGGIVFAVLLGGVAFLGFANREKISSYLAGPAPEKDLAPVAQELSSDLILRLDLADVAWISDRLLESSESRFDGGPRPADLKKLVRELTSAGAASSWHMVNVRRCQGKFDEARTVAGELQKGAEQSYSLALLDLAEAGDSPPWPVILERLKEASTGERGRFVARSAYIYALAASGDVARARADFDALSQLAGATEAPLFTELKSYLERLAENGADVEPEEATPTGGEEQPEADGGREEAMRDEAVDAQPEPEKEKAEPKSTPEPEAKPADDKKPAPDPQPKDVSEEIKQKVAQADAMWRGGNQDGALVIYRQVVGQIGTSHFLGQRSAARIRQAEREKAAAQ